MHNGKFKPASVEVEMFHEVPKNMNSQFIVTPAENSLKCVIQ
jgi:hypothetical protein